MRVFFISKRLVVLRGLFWSVLTFALCHKEESCNYHMIVICLFLNKHEEVCVDG